MLRNAVITYNAVCLVSEELRILILMLEIQSVVKYDTRGWEPSSAISSIVEVVFIYSTKILLLLNGISGINLFLMRKDAYSLRYTVTLQTTLNCTVVR